MSIYFALQSQILKFVRRLKKAKDISETAQRSDDPRVGTQNENVHVGT